jgi:hypothetical protein
MATGRLGPQLTRLERLLEETRARNLARVVMIHHPPLRRGAAPMRRLDDADALEAILIRAGAELVLHGHNHVFSLDFLKSPASRAVGGRIPILGAPSASSGSRAPRSHAAYHLLRLERAADAWRIFGHARGPVGDGREIAEVREIVP